MACLAALDRETTWRHDKSLSARLRHAKLRHQAAPEDVDYRSPRGLERRLFEVLLNRAWIDAHDNLAIFSPTGIGKSWLACAIGHKACRDNRSVLYVRFTRLLEELALARGDGRIASRLKNLASVELLILDDWGVQPMDAQARHDLLEILEDWYGRKSTIVTSQLPAASWHHAIGDPTYADAILDRLLLNAHRVELEGDSLRHTKASISD